VSSSATSHTESPNNSVESNRASLPPRGIALWLKITFGIAVVSAGGLYFVRNWPEISAAFTDMGVLPMFAPLLPALGGLVAAMAAWRVLLSDLGAPLSMRDAGRVYFASQLGKYLPGPLWTFVAQVEFARDLKVPRAVSFGASMLGVVLSLTIGIVIGVVLLPFGRGAEFLVDVAAPARLVDCPAPAGHRRGAECSAAAAWVDTAHDSSDLAWDGAGGCLAHAVLVASWPALLLTGARLWCKLLAGAAASRWRVRARLLRGACCSCLLQRGWALGN
jgi:hypothetical protein